MLSLTISRAQSERLHNEASSRCGTHSCVGIVIINLEMGASRLTVQFVRLQHCCFVRGGYRSARVDMLDHRLPMLWAHVMPELHAPFMTVSPLVFSSDGSALAAVRNYQF